MLFGHPCSACRNKSSKNREQRTENREQRTENREQEKRWDLQQVSHCAELCAGVQKVEIFSRGADLVLVVSLLSPVWRSRLVGWPGADERFPDLASRWLETEICQRNTPQCPPLDNFRTSERVVKPAIALSRASSTRVLIPNNRA